MAVYTERVTPAASFLGNSNQVLYTVPASKVLIVRSIQLVTNTRTTTRACALAIGTTATRSRRFYDASITGTVWLETRLTLYAGETIEGVSDAVDALAVHITGYLFTTA